MPQRKIQVPFFGGEPLFQKEMLQFVKKWPERLYVHRSTLELLANIAAFPDPMIGLFPASFSGLYVRVPDFTIGVIHFLRRKWKQLDKSKAGRLKRFLATQIDMKPADGRRRPQNELTDGQIATAYEDWSLVTYKRRESVSIYDVQQARKAVAKRICAGERLAAESFDKNGRMRCEGQPARRKKPSRKVERIARKVSL